MARDQRRLAAIVSADVAGYSRLMGHDESGTLAALKAHRRELIDPKIAEYGGRIVKTTGDGLLLEFPSVVEAVRCAVDVQRGMAQRNAGMPVDQRIDFRVGVNVGDIIIDDDDIFGDGVNVAARLQALAEPGEICVSKVVRDQVLDKLSFAFEELGAQQVKNIVRPVEVYRILDGVPAANAEPRRIVGRSGVFSRITRGARWGWSAVAAALVTVAGIAIWHGFIQPKSPAAVTGPPAMSVAVMPFTPASASADDELLAERLTQDVTAGIERARRALVVSHGLVAAKYKGKPTDPREVGRDLNVRYVFEGEVSRQKDADAVMARLIETATGTTVWNGRLAAPASSGSPDKSELVAQLSNRLRDALYDAEAKRVTRLPMSGASAMETVLRAGRLWDQNPTPKGTLAAHKLYEEALRQDPNSLEAVIGLYWTDALQIEDEAEPPENTVRELNELSKRAIALNRDDSRVWDMRSYALLVQGQWQGALEANAEALRIDPYSNRVVSNQGWLLLLTGRPAEALPVLERAIALDPRSRGVHDLLRYQCSAYLNLGQYDEAIAACEKSLVLEEDSWSYLFLLGALAQKGDMAKAEVTKARLLKLEPDISIARVRAPREFANPLYQQQREAHLYAGLRKVGIPEQ
jgi:class 3 adenylate cyclase/TolB-like protein/tetratricopeptide (TPR) repeat protein